MTGQQHNLLVCSGRTVEGRFKMYNEYTSRKRYILTDHEKDVC